MTHTIIIEGQRDAVSREYRDMAKTQFAEFGLRKTDVVVSVEATRGGNVEACIARASVGAPMFFRYDATGRHAIANPYAAVDEPKNGEPVRFKADPAGVHGCSRIDKPAVVTYVVAGVDGKGEVVASLVDVPASLDDFARDMRALGALPVECFRQRGAKQPAAWPLESPQGTALAVKLGLATPVPALEESTEEEPVRVGDVFTAQTTDKRGEIGVVCGVREDGVVLQFADESKRLLTAGELGDIHVDRQNCYSCAVAKTCSHDSFETSKTCADYTSSAPAPVDTTPDVGRKGGTAGGSLLVEPASVKPRKSLGGSRVSKREAGSYRYDWGGVSFSVVRQSFGDRPNVWNVYLLGAENVFVDFFETKTAAVEFLNGYACEYATAVSREYWKHDDEKRERAGVVVGAEVEVHYRGRDYVGRVTEVVKTGLDPVRVRVVFNIASGGRRVRVPVWRAVRVVDQTNDAR